MALLFLEAIINDFLLHHFRGHYLTSRISPCLDAPQPLQGTPSFWFNFHPEPRVYLLPPNLHIGRIPSSGNELSPSSTENVVYATIVFPFHSLFPHLWKILWIMSYFSQQSGRLGA